MNFTFDDSFIGAGYRFRVGKNGFAWEAPWGRGMVESMDTIGGKVVTQRFERR